MRRESIGWVVRIFIDKPGSRVSLDECSAISHALDPALDGVPGEQAGGEHHGGVRGVRAARDGRDHDGPIDVLVTDVVMAGMTGPELAKRVAAMRDGIAILFMSGYAEEQLRRSIDIGNVAFLPKPFSVQELAEAARRALTPV